MINAAMRLYNRNDATAEQDAIAQLSKVFDHPDKLRRSMWGYLHNQAKQDPTIEEPLRLLLATAEERQGDDEFEPITAAELGWLTTVLDGW
jgi:hypothetical protein